MTKDTENIQVAAAETAPAEKTTVLDADDVIEMVPRLKGHRKLVDRVLHWLQVDKVNEVHSRGYGLPGPEFVKFLLDDFRIDLRIDNEHVLDNLPEGAFITVRNHTSDSFASPAIQGDGEYDPEPHQGYAPQFHCR